MTIHKEGYFPIATTFIVFVCIALLFYWFKINSSILYTIFFIETIVFLLVLQFFRNPSFNTIHDINDVIAPADGKVVVIENTKEKEVFKDTRIQISIFMSPLNVHINRSPVSGIVDFFKYHKGKFLVAWKPKSSTDNERTTLIIKTESGKKVLVRQIAGAVARRIKWYVKEGQKLKNGDEFGFIKFGSRVDVFLPLNTTILVKEGDKTKGGKTIIGKLKS